MNRLVLITSLLSVQIDGSVAFVQQQRRPPSRVRDQPIHADIPEAEKNNNVASQASSGRTDANPDFFKPFLEKNFVLPESEVNPLLKLNVGSKEKVVNAFGLWTLVVCVLTGPLWAAVMYVLNAAYEADTDNQYINKWDPNRAIYDGTGKVWSRVWLAMTMSTPTLSGDVDRLKEGQGACLYVANHASWLDIPVLCTVLDPVFKFIAKGELGNVPCIGQQLNGVSTYNTCFGRNGRLNSYYFSLSLLHNSFLLRSVCDRASTL